MKKSDFRVGNNSEDYVKRPVKLSPVKKSGKERHIQYDDDESDFDFFAISKRESAYDYYDDGDEK